MCEIKQKSIEQVIWTSLKNTCTTHTEPIPFKIFTLGIVHCNCNSSVFKFGTATHKRKTIFVFKKML